MQAFRGAIVAGCCLLLSAVGNSPAMAQLTGPAELTESVSLDLVDNAARTHLERVSASLGDGQWDEAVETLRRVLEEFGDKLIETPSAAGRSPGFKRYVPIQEHCHWRISALPPEALELYRQRVDPQAKVWFERGVQDRDPASLQKVIDSAFCSSWGDNALLALGDLATERGHFDQARLYYGRLVPQLVRRVERDFFEKITALPGLPEETAKLLDEWYVLNPSSLPPAYELQGSEIPPDDVRRELDRLWRRTGWVTSLSYPDTDLDLPTIHARWVLMSILDGEQERARQDLASFARMFPNAEGHLGGRQVPLARMLAAIYESSAEWQAGKSDHGWRTFAGEFSRNGQAPQSVEIDDLSWPPIGLHPVRLGGENMAFRHGARQLRVAEFRSGGEDANQGLLSYHPVIANGRVFFCDENYIYSFNLSNGRPAWSTGVPGAPPGAFFRPEHVLPPRRATLGAPRFTLSIQGNLLLARMGSPVTSAAATRAAFGGNEGSYLVALDISADPLLVWKHEAERGWAFEGTPVTDGHLLYVGMRRSGVTAQAHVACFDPHANRMLWRRYICSADSLGHGQVDECTHNLLTLHEGQIYYNTNAGCVAALSPDGQIRWITTYPRARTLDVLRIDPNRGPAHYYRDLTPCLFYQGKILAAPSDTPLLFALDASNGQFLWETDLAEDCIHLLGAHGKYLLASGDRLLWINLQQEGRIDFERHAGLPKGYGRGIIAGDRVYFPTIDRIYVYDIDKAQPAGQPIGLRGNRPANVDPASRHLPQAMGGNLVISGQQMLIASDSQLFSLQIHPLSLPERVVAENE